MDLTQLDKELLDGLQVLTDQEIGRVQAHLAAGLPMQIDFGWKGYPREMTFERGDAEPSCFGCLIGTAMSYRSYIDRRSDLVDLAVKTFPSWLIATKDHDHFDGYGDLGPVAARRLAALLDMEWSRRQVMAMSNPVEQTHDSAIIPSLEAVPV